MRLEKKYTCNFATFDLTEYPIIKIITTCPEPDLKDIKEYQLLKKDIFDAIREEVVFIFDTSAIKWIPADARIELGKGVRDSEDNYSSIIRKSYMVIPNVVQNILFKGINLVSQTNLNYSVHKTYEEAYQKAKKELNVYEKFNQTHSLLDD